MDDLVIDTNVLVHATAKDVVYFADAKALILKLFDAETKICIDDGFNFQEAANTSLIGHEYLKHLNYSMLGYQLLVFLAQNGRIRLVSTKVESAVNQQTRRLVPRNKRDRTFVRVAYNSHDRILASHDFDDFSNQVRKGIRKRLSVTVVTAKDVISS